LIPFSVGLEPTLLYFDDKNPVPQGICLFRKESESREGISSGNPGSRRRKYNMVIKTLHGPTEALVYHREYRE